MPAPAPSTGSTAVECLSDCTLPTEFGERCHLRIFGRRGSDEQQHWVTCDWGSAGNRSGEGVHVRVHDACLTSEVLGSLKCDCAQQLRLAQRHLSRHSGILIYTPQECVPTKHGPLVSEAVVHTSAIAKHARMEPRTTAAHIPNADRIAPAIGRGRGIGLAKKSAAYALQDRDGLDTVDANVALGLPAEARDYSPVRTILEQIGVQSVVLLTNNPFKMASLRALGIRVTSRQSVLADVVPSQCEGYLQAKAARMGHLLSGRRDRPRGGTAGRE